MFMFRCIKGKDGKPQELLIDEEDVVPNKRKKPSRKQRTGKKGRAEEDLNDVDQSEGDARAPAPKTAPTNKGKGNMKSRPQRGGEEKPAVPLPMKKHIWRTIAPCEEAVPLWPL